MCNSKALIIWLIVTTKSSLVMSKPGVGTACSLTAKLPHAASLTHSARLPHAASVSHSDLLPHKVICQEIATQCLSHFLMDFFFFFLLSITAPQVKENGD